MTIGALAMCFAWAPFGDMELRGLLAALVLIILGYTGFRVGYALRSTAGIGAGMTARRIRQQFRLVSRSWLECTTDGRTLWVPVYFDPALMTLTPTRVGMDGRAIRLGELRVYPAGRSRNSEPVGRLVDNPSRPDPDGGELAATAARWRRRLLLDAQPAVVAPFVGLFWVYVAGGGTLAFVAVTVVAGTTVTWLSAVRGSDPS
ncbi:hypothetical protein [Nocardia sp. CC227C]|uniref:hypothetical protein n=1 Tax=Nocardia sp. CC227C TaxID=3044562 RepID=UPI00278BAEED|nr:hypothetical protein [Nocardia sp. CC227C]